MTNTFNRWLQEQAHDWAQHIAANLCGYNVVLSGDVPKNVILLTTPQLISERLEHMGFRPGVDDIPEQAMRTAMEGAVVEIVNVRMK